MNIEQHFRADEKQVVQRMLDYAQRVGQRHIPELTDFMDPREQFICQSVVGHHMDVQVTFEGGFHQAERKRALIMPDYLHASFADFQIGLLEIEPLSTQSKRLRHQDILGSLLGLGLKREKFGDILIEEQKQQIVVAEDMAPFVTLHLHHIGKTKVHCQSVAWDQRIEGEDNWQERYVTVNSLRLDVILSEVLHLSRSKTSQLIKAGKVKVNWKVTEQPALQLDEGDVLSVRGMGRLLFTSVEGITKKNKYRVCVARKK